MIEFSCSKCGSHLKAPESRAGKQARCPKCGTESKVPVITKAAMAEAEKAATAAAKAKPARGGGVHEVEGGLAVCAVMAVIGHLICGGAICVFANDAEQSVLWALGLVIFCTGFVAWVPWLAAKIALQYLRRIAEGGHG